MVGEDRFFEPSGARSGSNTTKHSSGQVPLSAHCLRQLTYCITTNQQHLSNQNTMYCENEKNVVMFSGDLNCGSVSSRGLIDMRHARRACPRFRHISRTFVPKLLNQFVYHDRNQETQHQELEAAKCDWS